MKRILLTIEYDGTNYVGWQRQKNGMAIQQVIEECIATAQGETVIHGSGRTDAGVHAWGQRAHFDSTCTIPPEMWRFYLNDRLPGDIRIVSSEEVAEDFHARFWAKDKTYQYCIHNSRSSSAIRRNFSWFVPQKLDDNKMERALGTIVGRHDFSAFASARSEKKENSVREIYRAEMRRDGDEILLTTCGNGFLHNMVRIIAGSLVDIGRGKLDEDAFLRAFESGDRLQLGDTAFAGGLFLKEVRYYTSRKEAEMARDTEMENLSL